MPLIVEPKKSPIGRVGAVLLALTFLLPPIAETNMAAPRGSEAAK